MSWLDNMNGIYERSSCEFYVGEVELIWYECEGELIVCESELWIMVRYPWGAAKLYLIKKDPVEQNRDL